MEVTVKEEFSEDSSSFDTKHQNPLQARHGRDIPMDNSQQPVTMEAFEIVKVEIHEYEDKPEIEEHIYPFELSNMLNSFNKKPSYNTAHFEACSQLEREEIRDNAPSKKLRHTKKTGTNKNFNKSYEEKKKKLVNFPLETRPESTYSGKKSFACNICDYKCNHKSHLKDHIRTHTGEKPFACNICDYKCSKKSNLREHIRIHSGEKPFACNICKYKWSKKSNLREHIRAHAAEKPFACNICDYKSNKNYHLKRHLRTHTGEKPFACNICDYKCKENHHLKRHIRTHTSENY